jgi:hypothetical protein
VIIKQADQQRKNTVKMNKKLRNPTHLHNHSLTKFADRASSNHELTGNMQPPTAPKNYNCLTFQKETLLPHRQPQPVILMERCEPIERETAEKENSTDGNGDVRRDSTGQRQEKDTPETTTRDGERTEEREIPRAILAKTL